MDSGSGAVWKDHFGPGANGLESGRHRDQTPFCRAYEGATVVGQAEHEEQSAKHGGNKDMLVLAKKVSPGPPLDGP